MLSGLSTDFFANTYASALRYDSFNSCHFHRMNVNYLDMNIKETIKERQKLCLGIYLSFPLSLSIYFVCASNGDKGCLVVGIAYIKMKKVLTSNKESNIKINIKHENVKIKQMQG